MPPHLIANRCFTLWFQLGCCAVSSLACSSKELSGPGDTSARELGGVPTTLWTPSSGTSINSAGRNSVYLCPRNGLPFFPPLTRPETPWVEGDSIVISEIPSVQGSVSWDSEFEMRVSGTQRRLVGNGLPNHPTGTFAVERGTDAYPYYAALPAEGYDNASEIPITPYDLDVTLPLNPQPNAEATCVDSILTGVVSQTGGTWHVDVAVDADDRLLDPSAGLPMDSCWGHPYMEQYHYHGFSWSCFPDQGEPGRHSPLFGYAIDGFGVFGPLGEEGEMVTNSELDECHGHTHSIDWDGEVRDMYHYHVNNEYPYSIGCFRGTPVDLPHQLQH